MSEEGSDDSPPRPKRKIKKVVVLSSSDSESDGSFSVAGTRRKRLRVLSDEEASDSSGSSVVRAGTRRRRTLPKLRDSEAESDSSGWSTDHVESSKPVTSASKSISGFASDSSEGNSDKCSICLLRFKEQEVGTPESCEHIFCLDCITEWSKNVNTCPVDRMTFNSIIVKACVGGRVLRKEPVKVIERRPSVEALVVEDPTVCEICGSTEDEETMLLCDGCDLGYHMQCLSPPLAEVPADQWLCPNCYVSLNGESNLLEDINLSEVEDLLEGVVDIDLPLGPRSVLLRQQRNVRRSSRNVGRLDQPSTSSAGRANSNNLNELSLTSRGSTSLQRSSGSTIRRQGITKRRKYKRRRTKTVIIEYEVQENGKFPITKRVKKKVKRRRVKKRQPRTAARRSYVRASVRAKLATLRTDQRADMVQASNATRNNLSVRRQRAGIPSLSLYGNPHELDYFSDEDNAISEEASTAVATRSTSNILSAYRQARRKMIMVPSPPHASSAPDILSNILESQTLLHSKKSIISISVDGNVDYKLESRKENHDKNNVVESKNEGKLDLSKANETVRNVPSYPGQNRGGGWGGGYRGNYHREQNSNNFNRGGNYENNYGGNYQNRQGNAYNYQNNNMRRDDADYYDNFSRRPQQYSHTDDTYFDRSRRPGPMDNNRGSNYSNHQRPNDQSQGRFSLGPSWQPYSSGGPSAPTPRQDVPPTQSRHSFGGFENPVDMRMGQVPPTNTNTNSEMFSGIDASRQEKTQPHAHQPLSNPQAYQPLTEPPVFNFQKNSEVEKSEDEKSDSGLVIDTEKYDPTEPTHDDDSGEDEPIASSDSELPPPPAVQSILAGIDTSAMNVPPNILDTAVRQVLKEHRNLIVPPNAETHNRSDDDSDGDCPNFSIYSATSVHIANNSSSLTDEVPKEQPQDSLEDLVQEDDETPPSTSPITISDPINNEKKTDVSRTSTKPLVSSYDMDEKKKSEEEYKEKVSKRCPITTNTRNPIKIKLNTSSLIKRQVSLYDEEDTSQDVEANEKTEVTREMSDEKLNVNCNTMSLKKHDESPKKKSPSPEKCVVPLESNEITKSERTSSPLINNVINKDISEKQELIIKESVDDIVNENKDDDNKCENIRSNTNTSLEKREDSPKNKDESDEESHSDGDDVPIIFTEQSPKLDAEVARVDDNVEKMTESISETEDERSYTPCLDENKSNKDASFETEKDKGLEGLDTEMISEEEGNEMFSENERAASEISRASPPRVPPENEEGEIADKKKEGKKVSLRDEGAKKKKKKESKKETKEKSKSRKKSEISFKKLSKSGKERNYRERDKNEKRSERERRDSGDANESRQRRRKEKRKDLERYDVRTVVTEKRRKQKDPFGRDVSPRGRSPSLSPPPRSPSPAPSRRRRRSLSRGRRSLSRIRRSPSPSRRSLSRRRSPPGRRSAGRRSSPARGRSPARSRASLARARRSASSPRRRSGTPRASPRRRSPPRRKRRRSGSRPARRRSLSASPPRRAAKKKKRTRSARRAPAAGSPERKRRRSASRQAEPEPEAPSPMSRPPSPRTPPPEPEPEPRPPLRSDDELERRERRRRDPDRLRRRVRDAAGPSKEVFTSGDNILVSVSFKEQECGEEGDRRRRRETRRDRRRRRRAAVPPEVEVAKPVAIIDLERSPFRELTPSPKNVIVLSDSDHGEREGAEPGVQPAPAPEPAPEPAPPALGPKTPPEPTVPEPAAPEPAERPDEQAAAPGSERQSPDAYDPFEPTRSASASPASASPAPEPAPPSPPRALITLEAAQRSNMSADEVLDRRPLTPVEKVMALLQSTRDASPEPAAAEAPPAPAPRIVLPSPTRVPPKLFPGKPSPIKSNPVKPMQAARLQRAPSEGGASPYSPGSSDFGELFEPPPRRARLERKRGKTQVGVKIDEENLKILDDLPSSAVEMQVKSKFLKKLNRQERVVEEVKLVLKPHYIKKRVTKEEYKDILRRAVPKICHNKSGEINPTKIQALVEAYVKKFRKKHKLGMA